MNRRQLIRIGAASVGTLALRPFGLLPALAQSGPDYRALVCVFLFGGNDSNNAVIPMDDTNFKAYTSIRGSLALTTADLTPTVTSVSGAPYAFHSKLAEVASMFSSKELAVVANVGSLVQPLTRAQYQAQQLAIPSNLFSHLPNQQLRVAIFDRTRQQLDRMGRPRRRLHRRPGPQFFQLSRVFLCCRQHARRHGRKDAACGARAGAIADSCWLQFDHGLSVDSDFAQESADAREQGVNW